ncbi:10026_t:CDS:2, partial [Gigaspora margarita]
CRDKIAIDVSTRFTRVTTSCPGASVLRQYNIGEQIASAGLWKIYSGTKKTTGQKVDIFEKKIFENTLLKNYEKKETDKVYQVLKRESTCKASLLEIVEAVEESRTVITIAIEPILASRTNLLRNTENLSSVPDDIKNFDLDELEIQKGLFNY